MQAYDSIMFRYALIDFILKAKGLLEYTNLFPPKKH